MRRKVFFSPGFVQGTMAASRERNVAATEAAFRRAVLVTLTGSMTPRSCMSV
jgi:hypothetical protein